MKAAFHLCEPGPGVWYSSDIWWNRAITDITGCDCGFSSFDKSKISGYLTTPNLGVGTHTHLATPQICLRGQMMNNLFSATPLYVPFFKISTNLCFNSCELLHNLPPENTQIKQWKKSFGHSLVSKHSCVLETTALCPQTSASTQVLSRRRIGKDSTHLHRER